MKQINITRDSSNQVTFDPVSIDVTENVFFTNLDPDEEHWPELSDNKLGKAPSPNSSQCIVPPPGSLKPPNNKVSYKCKLHSHEEGTISVFAQLAAKNTTLQTTPKDIMMVVQQVVTGGQSPYRISGQQFQITDSNNNVIDQGSGIGPGIRLNPDQINSGGITVSGIPTVLGTYKFTFIVTDNMGKNLQQVQYSMKVH